MKRGLMELCFGVILGLFLPVLILNTRRLWKAPQQMGQDPAEPGQDSHCVKIQVLFTDDRIQNMDLEEYVLGVVLGEMPASFEEEAQKAQAVVARTYALRCRERSRKHPLGALCTNPGCCQGYRSPGDFIEAGGTEEALNRVRQAVSTTRGLVLTYEGQLIEATYFSSAGGRTEDAQAVWGNSVPYLQAVDSPEEGYSDKYLHTVTIPAAEFLSALGLTLEGPCETWLGEVTRTDGEGVDTMMIGGRLFRGTELRTLLNLRSTAFLMTAVGDRIIVTTRGFGHRVGMSQYGAEAMAVSGASFREILSHYYLGTTLEAYIDKAVPIG